MVTHTFFSCIFSLLALSAKSQNCTSDDPRYENQISVNPDLSFYWTIDDVAKTLDGRLHYSAGEAWLAVGWSADPEGSMIGSEVVLGLPNSNEVSKRVLESYTVQGVKEANQQTLTGTSIVASNGETDMTFVKSLDEPGEIVIDATGINTLVFAVGSSGTLGFHSLFFIENVNLASCESSTVHTDSMNPDAVRIHAILMICAWAYLLPSGIAVAIFKEQIGPRWFYIHQSLQFVAVLMMIIAISIIVNELNRVGLDHMNMNPTTFGIHTILGVEALTAAGVQVVCGVCRPHKSELGKSPTPARKLFDLVHPSMGHLSVILAFFAVLSGIEHAYDFSYIGQKEKYIVALLVPLSLFFLSHVVWTIWSVLKKRGAVTTTGALVSMYVLAILLAVAMNGP